MNEYKNPYRQLAAAGMPIESHESDLYVLATHAALDIVLESGWQYSRFTSQIDGREWLEVPFAYEPFWTRREVQS